MAKFAIIKYAVIKYGKLRKKADLIYIGNKVNNSFWSLQG